MATVPRVSGPSEQLNAAPNAYQSNQSANADAFGAGTGRLLSQAGQVAGIYGQQLKLAQDEIDQVRVDDALNKIKERQIDLTFNKDTGFTNLKGLNALERSGGRPLADEYGEELQKTISELSMSMGSERQRQALQMRANDILTGFRGQIMQHEGKEFQNYTASVREGTIANRKREIGLFYNDPARIDEAVQAIQASVADLGRNLGGKSAAWIEARQRQETSSAHVIALSAAMEQNNIAYADGYLKKYASQMEADDILKVRGVLDKQVDAGIAMSTATKVIQSAQVRMDPPNVVRLEQLVMNAESGGRRYGPDGKTLLTSPKGAKGEMQVMDATNLDPGYGVRPAQDNSPDERARVGREYLAAMVKEFKGDIPMALAAYNAGPGAVEKAVKKGGDWLSNLPKETQDYVAKISRAYGDGGGAPARPTLEELQSQVRAEIGVGNPTRLKLALDEVGRQYEVQTKAIKQREDQGEADAQRWLVANNGNFNAMPASVRSAIPPGKMDSMLSFSDRIAKGVDRTNPAVYQRLSNDDFLRSLSEDEFYSISMGELSESDRKDMARRRNTLLTGSSGDKPGDLSTSTIKSTLDTRLREIGLDPTPKDGTDEAGRVGALRQFIDRSVLAEQSARGKKLTDAELIKHVDGLFAQTDTIKRFWGADEGVQMLNMRASDIPGDVRYRIKADFKANGISNPSDGQIIGAYWTAKTAAKKTKRSGGATGGY
jgi:soluble lytic murein transglycosylase